MFNLLRRSKNRKSHKSKNYETNTSGDDDDAEGGTSAAIARNYTAQRAAVNAREQEQERERRERMTAHESYRQFSEEESVREHCRAALPYRRAVIDELEDFGDLDEVEAEEHDDDNEERTTTDNDMFYFEQLRQQQPLSQRRAAGAGSNDVKEYEKVKLAKTAAKLSGEAAITRIADLKTNSAKTNESSRSIADDNNINKISNTSTRAAIGGWAGATIESQQATVSVASDGSDTYALSLANTGRSQNEEAKWQGHTVSEHKHDKDEAAGAATFGTNQKLIGKIIKTSNRNDQANDNDKDNGSSSRSRSRSNSRSSEHSQRATAIKQFNSSSPIRLSGSKRISNIESQVENAEKSVVNNGHRNNNNSNNNTATGNDNDDYNKTRSTEISQRTGFGTDADANAVETVISQVKYRNFGNTQKTRQSETTKRQSRLSLTNFGFGKINTTATTTTTTSNNNKQHVTDACTKDKHKQPQSQQQQQRSTIKPSTTFFGINRKSQQQKSNNSEKQSGSVEVAKKSLVKPLQKSCEFLSDIFMARGRNHNRNRNNHNTNATHHQHQQQQQKQSTKAIHHTPSSVGTAPPPLLGSLAPPTLQMTIENDIIMDDIDNDDQRVVHLETNSDPAACLSTTNSYQMTESNNSNKNFYLTQYAGEQQAEVAMEEAENEAQAESQESESAMCESAGACESNSADEESADQVNMAEDEERDDDNYEITGVAASVSVPIEIDVIESAHAATVDEGSIEADDGDGDSDNDDGDDDVVVELKQANATEHDFIHAANVDQQGVQQLANAAEQRQQREIEPIERQEGNATEILLAEARRTNVDGNVDLTECEQLLSQNINSNNSEYDNNNSDSNSYSNNNENNNNKEQANCIDSVSVCSADACDITPMGQSHPNGRTENGIVPNGSRASTPREFRESVVTERTTPTPPVALPKIMVVDYSDNGSVGAASEQSPKEQEIFYDSEQQQQKNHSIDIVSIDDDDDDDDEAVAVEEVLADDDDEVFEMDIPTTVYQQQQQQQQRWTRLSHVKLENVPEQEEEEDEEDEEEEGEDEGKPNNDYDEDADDDNLGRERERELYKRQIRSTSSDKRESTERTARSPLKSTNTSDSNLSTSYPDSGIGIDLSQQSSAAGSETHAQIHAQAKATHSTAGARNATVTMHARSPFVRDGNSTDCDETLMQCDELNDDDFLHANERLVCIESISLPDVVVESTTASNASSCGNVNGATASLQSSSAAATSSSSSSQGEQIININGATGNSVGNVHFIPIHIEGGSGGGGGKSMSRSRSRSGSPKQRSFDDSCIGSKRSYAQLNGHQMPPTIEIIEDASVLNTDATTYTDYEKDLLKQELNEHKAHYALQIEDAQKNVHKLEHKVIEMQTKIEKMEQELSQKTWNVERLQGELSAAQKDDEFVRQKLKRLEEEKTNLRHKYSDNEDNARRKHSELETQYQELDEKYKQTQNLAASLQTQLAAAQTEAEQWRTEVEKIRVDLEEQLRILKNALENSEAERKICEDKWQKEFEMLRTHNMEREETLMTDCEWQLRQTQRQWKDKCDKAAHERQVAQHKADELQEELTQRNEEVENLRVYEAQVNSLRGVVNEQEHSIQSLMARIESLTTELESTKDNLELQIEAVAKIKYQCDNAIYDKERQMIYRIDEVRNEAAAFWEDKLYTEMTRLKNELESVYVDERRDALDKLQIEHIEELRALTTRYTANEDELRAELEELQERLDKKSEEYLQLREKSDNSLLQTRMHLDRADRDFQAAMCREEERREELEQKLQKEFEAEKEEMEEKFRERLGQVKDEFAKELQLSTQDVVAEHRLELEKQKAKLIAEKEQAIQELTDRHRNKLAAVEENIKDIELRHKRDLKDLKAAYDAEKAALDKRDISNANEIEMLHRKCRCLTNLFEEMRMRYERRDPRPEDLREIAELRGRCESQERDLYVLTDRLREMQIQMTELQQNGKNTGGIGKQVKKPPPKTIPTSCDVIYEENEERESPPPQSINTTNTTMNNYRQHKKTKQQQRQQEEQQENDNEEDDEDEDDDEEEEASDTESNHKIEINGKNIDSINEDDAHMITAV